MEEQTFHIDLKKINYTYVFFFVFLVLGVYLRAYHADFPAIGYHNMKENEYLDQVTFFMEKGDYLHKQAFAFYGFDETTGYHEEYGQMPLVPYMILVLWTLFGKSLLLARALMILFFMGAVFVTYYLTKRLTNNEFLSLLSTFFMTIMPLGIYFGRNVQPEAPALFFSLLSLYYYVKWLDDKSSKDVFYATLFLGIAGLFKYTFLIFAVPILAIFPFKEFYHKIMHDKKKAFADIKQGAYGLIPFALGVLVYEFLTIVDPSKKGYDVDTFRVFTSDYWVTRLPALQSFVADNYTMIFFFIAIAGLLMLAVFRAKTRFGKFCIGYALAFLPYIMMISSKIAGHSYYQMPFLPLICILGAYSFFIAGTFLKQITGSNIALFAPLLLLIFIVPQMQDANDRVFGTVFYGQDFLGEYLKTRMLPEERFTAAAHSQSLATCSYAGHRCGFVTTLEEFKHKEQVFNLRYFYVDSSNFNNLLNSEDALWVYVRKNYGIDLVGIMNQNNQAVPTHFILKKGTPFDLADIAGKQPVLAKTYDMKFGEVPYYYIQNTQIA